LGERKLFYSTDLNCRCGNRIHYRLASSNSASAQLFAIDSDTGVVTAAVSFDREQIMTVEATVIAECGPSVCLSVCLSSVRHIRAPCLNQSKDLDAMWHSGIVA